MSEKYLFHPITEQGVRNTNFFEGRLLSGKDLRDQLDAHKQHDRYLGNAIGRGIFYGLDIELDSVNNGSNGKPPLITVKKGMAINADGDVIGLPLDDITLSLSRTLDIPVFEELDFHNCVGIPYDQFVPNGVAIYLLVMCPAAEYKEKVPKSGLGDKGIAKGCGNRYYQEGVEFRLVEFPLESLGSVSEAVKNELKEGLLGLSTYARKNDIESLSRLKNYLANICFGNAKLLSQPLRHRNAQDKLDVLTDPVLDELTALGDLESFDVPLCLFYWTPEGITFLDNWSVRRIIADDFTFGRLRLLQFADHMQWLSSKISSSKTDRIGDYFRFLPPAGLVPERVFSADKGFRSNDFMEGLIRGVTDQTSVGQINRFLLESLDFPSIDLNERNWLQVFSNSNLDTLKNNQVTQKYYLFLTRDLFGVDVRDEIAEVISDTWSVYRGILRRQVFLPSVERDSLIGLNERINARTTIINSIEDVMSIANRYAAAANSDVLNVRSTLRGFRELFDIQKELVQIFSDGIPGTFDTQEREIFAANIDSILTVSTPPDGPGYAAAIADNDLYAVLNSQIEINRFVGQWSGEGVATGPFYFEYIRSPQGSVLVPGEDPTPHIFRLQNSTNKSLEFDLDATLQANSGDWSRSVTIARMIGGDEITSLFVEKGTSRNITLMLSAPGAPNPAVIGEALRFSITASVGSPTNRTNTYNSSPVTIGDEGGAPVTGNITAVARFVNSSGGTVSTVNLTPGVVFFLDMDIRFQIPDPAGDGEQVISQANLAVDLQLNTHEGWRFFDMDENTLNENPPDVFTIPLQNFPANDPRGKTLGAIFPPAQGGDSSVELRLTVRTTGLSEEVSITLPTIPLVIGN